MVRGPGVDKERHIEDIKSVDFRVGYYPSIRVLETLQPATRLFPFLLLSQLSDKGTAKAREEG